MIHVSRSIEIKLDLIQKFQQCYPNSHVGGSIGLMLHGVNLKRSLNGSDLDMTSDYFIPEIEEDIESNYINFNRMTQEYLIPSHSDFEYCYIEPRFNNNKVEVRIAQNTSYDVIEFNGKNYNVTPKNEILRFKYKYASLGISKHAMDLMRIDPTIDRICNRWGTEYYFLL